jgi:sugar phosphate isomerase/epimerase
MRWSLATIVLVPRGCAAHAGRSQRQRVFAWAAEQGFEGIEISPHWLEMLRLDDAELRQVADDAAAAGVKISGINVNRCILTQGDAAGDNLNLVRRAIEVAPMLAAPILTLSLSLPLGGPPRPIYQGRDTPQAERDECARLLRQLAEQAAAGKVSLSLELHDDGLLDTADLCLDMLQQVSAANVGVNPDLGNLVRSDRAADWQAALRMMAPHANNWHVKNYRSGKPSAVWDGEIDYGQAFQIMHAAGYAGWVSIESYFADPLDLQIRSLAYLRGLDSACKTMPAPRGSAA